MSAIATLKTTASRNCVSVKITKFVIYRYVCNYNSYDHGVTKLYIC